MTRQRPPSHASAILPLIASLRPVDFTGHGLDQPPNSIAGGYKSMNWRTTLLVGGCSFGWTP